jgi:AraC family transcriptional regulator of arabinose operon
MDWRVRFVIARIERDLHRQLPLAELARLVNLSPSRFAHLFMREMGAAPGRYLRDRRLARARSLLEQSSLSIKEVMARVGVNDPSHFARDFKRRYGASPRTFRARTRSSGRDSGFGPQTSGSAHIPSIAAATAFSILESAARISRAPDPEG